MKKKQTRSWVVWTILWVLCTACRQPAVIYDSSEVSGDDSEIVEGAQEAEEAQTETCVYVYVCGEVQHPGVYGLPETARLTDAIEAAGGMTENAAKTYLNLAAYVTDGQKIEVPSVEEANVWKEEARQTDLVNLNRASAEQLMTLTGIGEAKAKDILRYREQHGEFSRVEELMEIPGIKAGVFQKIKDKITV